MPRQLQPKTDPDALPSEVKGLEDRPEAKNLVTIYASLADVSMQSVLDDFGGKMFSEFKPALSELAVDKLSPITSKMSDLLDDKAEIDRLLTIGNEKANEIAEKNIKEIYEIVGFWK